MNPEHVYWQFLTTLRATYTHLEPCVHAFAFGCGWTREYIRGHSLHTMPIRGDEHSLYQARMALERAHALATTLKDAPEELAQHVSLLKDADAIMLTVSKFFRISRRLFARKDNVQKRKALVRSIARELLVDEFKYAEQRVVLQSYHYTEQWRWKSAFLDEQARAELATAEMFKAQGRAQAEAEARARAEAKWGESAEAAQRYKALAEERAQLLDGKIADILKHVDGVPAMVDVAKAALINPFEIGAELSQQMRKNLSAEAVRLWEAVLNAGSLNKGYKKAGLSYGTAYRIWDEEIRPFLALRGIPDPVAVSHGKRTIVVSKDRMEGWAKGD